MVRFKAWHCVLNRSRFDACNEYVDSKSLEKLFRVLRRIYNATKLDEFNHLLEYNDFSESNKQHMSRLWNAKPAENRKWGIDVVIANTNIRKSLQPKVWMTVDEYELEMNVDVFAKLRLEVSRALNQIDSCTI
ncbi:unnamed protein product [Thelazia callipaeda]|uniref:COMM domain-containing protein n=1 Tax=Thelazia callipaeda TaxID=103827 RepID=A0A0N5CP95_THECL|nr:unnamed protein product [Thelazia callipaeda]